VVLSRQAAAAGIAAATGAFDKKKEDEPVIDGAAVAAATGGYTPAGGSPAVAPAAAAGPDPSNYDASLQCDGPTAGERVDWLVNNKGMSHAEAVSCVMKEFPNVFKSWWDPNADCAGVAAGERAQWLVNNKGLSMEDAKNQVRHEFPGVFGGGGGGGGKTRVNGKFPHTLSIDQTSDGPKLRFEVSPNNPENVSLVAFHYVINDSNSMNFDVRNSEGGKYVHVTPGGGGYPQCPPGAKVSYWLCAQVNGLLEEEPHGACPHPDRRLYWTAC